MHARLVAGGWEMIEEWNSCYWHNRLQCFMIVYVDDFKMAGPKDNLAEAWKTVRKDIRVGEPANVVHFLGVKHEFGTFKIPGKDKPVYGRVLNNKDFMKKCVDTYLQVAPEGTKLVKTAKTPFRKENSTKLQAHINKPFQCLSMSLCLRLHLCLCCLCLSFFLSV